MQEKHFNIYVDTGGTFTDCIGIDSDGNEYRQKVLSSSCLRGSIIKQLSETEFEISESWNINKDIFAGFQFKILSSNSFVLVKGYDCENKVISLESSIEPTLFTENANFEITSSEEAPILGIRLITQTALHEQFPNLILKLGSTKGTNALLERKGAKTLFITTKGFKDILEIGNQARADIFALNVIKRKQIASLIIDADERIDAKGNVLKNLDSIALKNSLERLKNERFDSVSITLMNSYINPKHEQEIKELLVTFGFRFISVSHELSPLIKIVPRAETAVANGYLAPIIYNYVNRIKSKIGNNSFQIMTSSGSLVAADNFHPKDSLLSGPAGGVVGASIVGERAGYRNIITFDMGGTSTDVSRYNGGFDYRFELEVGDSLINSSAIAIETVAAGGGSICGYDGYRLFVGPESASAFPGPACYGAGGPLTITDVNLLMGRLDSSRFGIPIYKEHAQHRLAELLSDIEQNTGLKQDANSVLNGFLDIANEIMAGAIRKISIRKGYNPKDFALVAFGGAGGLHACDMAEILNMRTVLLPRDAGLLSAYGIGNARVERFSEKQILQPYASVSEKLHGYFQEIGNKAVHLLKQEGFEDDVIEIRTQILFLRLKGQDSSIEVDFSEADVLAAFHRKYELLYGHVVHNRAVELEAIRVLASVMSSAKSETMDKPVPYAALAENRAGSESAPVFVRDLLQPGAIVKGPALFLDNFSTTFIKDGWEFQLHSDGTAVIHKIQELATEEIQQTKETELELFANRFMAIAENMGALLQRTALSVNIKERLDFSCALLDADGRLVANAPHIPVHLGGLGVCVQKVLEHYPLENGDTIVTNHPKFGGSHLPDVTFITPIFHKDKRIAFVANRAHHSEIGGISPGSMPPNAKNLSEEGVVIEPFHIIRKGKVDWDGMRSIFENAPYPTRSVEENLADCNAAIAANENGKQALLSLVKQYGAETVVGYFNLLKKHAGLKMEDTLRKYPNGTYAASEFLDDGSPIKVSVHMQNGRCTIDFSGSADVHKGNMNATEAIVQSVTIYVLRLLLNEPIPLNDGLLDPVTIVLPHGMLNPVFNSDPAKCPAVVGGNVEISMRLTDTLLKAFGAMAASQGTMNNTLFGNHNFGYYETICGGCGAGEGFHGASAVHHHMTNTRITDPEIMEHRYPVRLEEFSIRQGSGGGGKWHGGNGIVRKLTFLEPVNLSVLTQRRLSGPYGLKGGEDGKPGKQMVIRRNGETLPLNSIQNIDLDAGDSFIIETPGGGGYGDSKS